SWDEYFESIPTNKLPPLAEEDLASFAVEDGSAPEELEIRAYWCERLLDEAMERPWIVKDNPHVAAWLKAQAPALAKLNELSKRPKFYSPQVHEQPGGPLYEANDALVHGPIRKIPQLLKARTMLAIGEGRLDDAISDWETSYLISGYLADSPTVIHLLIGIACNGLTQESAYSIIFHPAVTQTQLQRMRSFRQRHICSYNAVKPFNIGERFFMLSSICNMARSGEIDVFTDESKKWVEPTEPSSLRLLGRRLLWNFDTVMKNGNAVYDRMVEMQKIEDDGKRIEAWDEFDEYVNRVSKEATPSEKHPFRYLARVVTREGRSTLLSQVLEVLFSPALSAVNKAVVRSKVQNDLVELGLALVLYQKEHGKFPAKLEQLVPKYVKEIPPDRLNSRPLGYRSTGDGVLLYTASHDGIDSGGYNDGNNDADDIAIFTPNMRPVKPKGAEGEKDAESPPLESK
ncbi:MAG: hypothetical protein SGJ20_05595, partial [Planctomycetota bacterium]|nr:hypothetical protein [Planctomycetota bacterium]